MVGNGKIAVKNLKKSDKETVENRNPRKTTLKINLKEKPKEINKPKAETKPKSKPKPKTFTKSKPAVNKEPPSKPSVDEISSII